MTNKPEFYIDAKGEHRWRIQAGNNRIIAESGEGYQNKHDAAEGLYSALTNTELREVRRLAKKAPVEEVQN